MSLDGLNSLISNAYKKDESPGTLKTAYISIAENIKFLLQITVGKPIKQALISRPIMIKKETEGLPRYQFGEILN